MKVMTTGPGEKGLPRCILGFFYLYFFLHWGTSILMFWKKLGFSLASITRYYLGDAELFMNPRSFDGLLEVTHFHLFAMGFFFVVFSHLLLFAPWPGQLKKLLIFLLAISLLADMGAGWLVRYLHAGFAVLKLGAFWLLQGVSFTLLIGLTIGVFAARPGQKQET